LGGVYPIKHSYFREKVDPAGFRPAHFMSHRRAEYGWELQGRRYSRPQGLGDRLSPAAAARDTTHDNPLRPAKAALHQESEALLDLMLLLLR
jgi:hypothetical protein